MTDYQLAEAFFKRLQERGFRIKFNHEAYGYIVDDLSEPHHIAIEIISSRDTPCFQVDFNPDGSFYRIAGFTDGYWQDEVDWAKY